MYSLFYETFLSLVLYARYILLLLVLITLQAH